MEELKKVVLIASNVLSVLLGEDLPNPRTVIFKKSPYIYRW
ncbi:hypothetical protein ACFLWI_01705 [Chloroflexota bacterium]